MQVSQDLLARNRAWAEHMSATQPGFFRTLAEQQSPKYLWVGCSDSRVPANDIVGLLPGELFVHRNVANVVVHSDLNCLSVLQYAVDVLKVEHVIVCGHYGCGGVRAALRSEKLGLIDNWLHHVRDVERLHRLQLDEIGDDTERVDRLCELNVIEQVVHVCGTTIVRDAWDRGHPLSVRGWIYGLHDGLVRELGLCIRGPDEVESAYRQVVSCATRPLNDVPMLPLGPSGT
jgi:carbonic anhydrase